MLAGRRIDPEHASVQRFPRDSVDTVSESIKGVFTECSVTTLICSAAAGADLLALRIALDFGISCRVIISSSTEAFRRDSVSDLGSEWDQMFSDVVQRIGLENLICIPAGNDDASSFRQVNERLFQEALAAKESQGAATEILCLAVWDLRRKEGADFTAEFIDIAHRLGLQVLSIPTVASSGPDSSGD